MGVVETGAVKMGVVEMWVVERRLTARLSTSNELWGLEMVSLYLFEVEMRLKGRTSKARSFNWTE